MIDLDHVLTETRLTYRKLDFWVRQGYLRPDKATPGTGRAREWTNSELAMARLMAGLVDGGFVPSAAAEHARKLRELIEADEPAKIRLGPGITLHVNPVVHP